MSTIAKQPPAYRTEWVDRWRPPKPLVGLQPIERMLLRHTFTRCPEARLVVAVIVRAIGDCLCQTNRRERQQARRFILGTGLNDWCDHVGLNPDFVRFVAKKAGYLADEKAHWQRVPIRVRIPQLLEPVIHASQSSVRSSAVDAGPLNTLGELTHARFQFGAPGGQPHGG